MSGGDPGPSATGRIRVGVAGAAGRMGQTVCAAVEDAYLALAGRRPGTMTAAARAPPGLPASWTHRQKSRASVLVA